MNVAYVRVSTAEQNEDRQIEALQKYNIEKWFTEKVSAKDVNRPELQNMIDFVRSGDTVYVHDFSRLARNTMDLLEITENLKNKDVKLISNKENFDTSTPTGKFMLTTIGAIAEFERSLILERQREGICNYAFFICKIEFEDWFFRKIRKATNFSVALQCKHFTKKTTSKLSLADGFFLTDFTLSANSRFKSQVCAALNYHRC